MALIRAHTSAEAQTFKIQQPHHGKFEDPDYVPFEVVLKILNMSRPLSVVAYHPSDDILNLCTKFEVLKMVT